MSTTSAAPVAAHVPAAIESVDIALSGGGFRATLFHLGVIGCLRSASAGNHHNLLKRVKTICSVSGGSILAAHLVSHWDDYCTDDEHKFHRRISQLVDVMMTRDVSGTVLSGSIDRLLDLRPLDTEQLAKEYVSLLGLEQGKDRWDDIPATRPDLYILATHLNTGLAGAFSRSGFDILPVDATHRHAGVIAGLREFARAANIRDQSITRAVAASSAFPPAFSPIPLKEGNETHMLTDGGVYDNSGVNYLRHLYTTTIKDVSGRMVIVSDAGREFSTELTAQYDAFITLALRVTDAQGRRIGEFDSAGAKTFFESLQVKHALFLSIHETVPPLPAVADNHSEKVQELLRTLRTELDAFSAEEVFALYRHGYRVAHRALSQRDLVAPTPSDPQWTPVDNHPRNPRGQSKGTLEAHLVGGDALKKDLKSVLVPRLMRKAVRKYRWYLMTATVMFVALLGALSYASYQLGAPHSAPAIRPSGAVRIASVTPDTADTWMSGLPSVDSLLTPGTPYAFATSQLGTLTNNQPRAAAVVKVERSGPLKDQPFFIFLDQSANGESRVVALRQAGGAGRYVVPSGSPNERLVGFVVAQSSLANYQTTVQSHVTITFEAP